MEDVNVDFVSPEDDAKSSPPPKTKRRVGRPRKPRDDSGNIIVDESQPVTQPKPRGPRGKSKSYADEIETGLVAMFDALAMFHSPLWKLGNFPDPDIAAQETQKVRSVAENFDKWFQSLAEDSAIRKWFAKTADTAPIIIATVGLSQLMMTKYSLVMMYKTHQREQMNAANQS